MLKSNHFNLQVSNLRHLLQRCGVFISTLVPEMLAVGVESLDEKPDRLQLVTAAKPGLLVLFNWYSMSAQNFSSLLACKR